MATRTNLIEGILVKKDELLSDLSKVYHEGLYHDITLVFPDNSRISTNKFMLVCRIPYFTTLLTSDFITDKSSELSLEVCSSGIFKKILDFVWTGEIQLSDMHLSTILTILETARFLCIDLLVDGVEEYIKHQFISKKIDYVSSLSALEFSITHKFPMISKIILGFVDLNLEEISSLPDFLSVSTDAMMMLLNMKDGRVSSEICLLKALIVWLEGQNEILEVTRREMANSFDLEKFSYSDMKILEKSGLFSEHLLHLAQSRIQNLEDMIKSLQPSTPYTLTFYRDEGSGYSRYISEWKMDTCCNVNSVEFNLESCSHVSCDSACRFKYTVQASTDGVTWSSLGTKNVLNGDQVVTFQRRKMQFLRITVSNKTNGCYGDIYRNHVRQVFAALM